MLPAHLPARFPVILFAAAAALGSSSPSTLPEGASQDWWSRAQRRIAGSEYEMTWQERPILAALAPSWHAPNRAQGFRTTELMATLPGEKLYSVRGYVAIEPVRHPLPGGLSIDFIRMRKVIDRVESPLQELRQ